MNDRPKPSIWKSFQLGLLVPATVLGGSAYISANNRLEELEHALKQMQELQSVDQGKIAPTSIKKESALLWSLIGTAEADEPTPRGKHQEIGFMAQLWYGLTGNLDSGWFVVVGSHKEKAKAKKQAAGLKAKGWDVEIGSDEDWNGYYAVLIGSYLSKDEAARIQELAIKEGLPKDTFLWKRTRPF